MENEWICLKISDFWKSEYFLKMGNLENVRLFKLWKILEKLPKISEFQKGKMSGILQKVEICDFSNSEMSKFFSKTVWVIWQKCILSTMALICSHKNQKPKTQNNQQGKIR